MEFRTENEILQEMVQKAQENGLISTDEDILTQIRNGQLTENQYILDLSAHAYILAQMEQELNEIYNNTHISTATGEALDDFGVFLNVTRYPPQPAVVDVQISIPVLSTEDITIPSGTLLITSTGNIGYGDYVLSESVTIPSGVDSVTARAESVIHGVVVPIPARMIVGVVGYNVNATNNEKGTNGSNIEEDDDYRIRLLNWTSKNKTGTRACIEDYLGHYEGVEDYNLVPRYEGVGTLKIIADTVESLLPRIADDVYRDCMDLTDVKPSVVQPAEALVHSIRVNLDTSSNMNISEEELTSLVIHEVDTLIHGGNTRDGKTVLGLHIGDDFVPSQVISHLLSSFPEIENVFLEMKEKDLLGAEYTVFNEVYSVESDAKLRVEEIVVTYG